MKRQLKFADNAWWILSIVGVGLGIWVDYKWGILGTAFLGCFIGLCLDDWKSNIFLLILLFGVVFFIVYNRIDELKSYKEKQDELRMEQVYLSGWDSNVDFVLNKFLNKSLPINNKPFNKDNLKNDVIFYLSKRGNSEPIIMDNFRISNCKVDVLISNGYNSSFESKNLKYIIIEDFDGEESGKYTDGSNGYIHIYHLYVIDFTKKKVVEHKIFKGGSPPHIKKHKGAGYGKPPTEEFNSYLKELFNISFSECTY